MSKNLRIAPEYRTNTLSIIEGGKEVTTIYADGTSRVYDNIKDVNSYVRRVKRNSSVVKILADNDLIWQRHE
jgi:hypothetical protein